jgi:hypothetical protein
LLNSGVLLLLVATQVLEHVKLELDGYQLQLKEKQPELILPRDRKKLYVENIDPTTTKDSLRNYIELKARIEVCDVKFGENGSSLLTFNEEPGTYESYLMCAVHCDFKFRLTVIFDLGRQSFHTKQLRFNFQR